MERTRKWMMVPAESECDTSTTEVDLKTAVQIALAGNMKLDGTLLDSRKKPIVGCNVYKCLTQKSSAKLFNKFLEIKALLSQKKNNKRKKVEPDWSEDDD